MDLHNSFSSLESLQKESPVTSINIPQECSKPGPNSTKTGQKNKITGMILICNGLKGTDHINQFQALLDLHDPGTESKLCSDISSCSVFPHSYTVFRKDRNRFGGGVFQAIKSDLVCVEELDFAIEN